MIELRPMDRNLRWTSIAERSKVVLTDKIQTGRPETGDVVKAWLGAQEVEGWRLSSASESTE